MDSSNQVTVNPSSGDTASGKGAGWSNELFAFDMKPCLYAICCTPCANASARTAYDGSNWLFNLFCLPSPMTRNIIREGYGIEGDCMWDIIFGTFLAPCAIVQQTKEAEKRGCIKSEKTEGTDDWQEGLFKFDLRSCACACIVPCCAMAQTRQDYDGSNYIFNCLCLTPGLLRNIIREGYGIKGTCIEDIFMSCILGMCEVARMMREVKVRGGKKTMN